MLKIEQILKGNTYPMNRNMNRLKENVESILRFLDREYPNQTYCFVGTGTSGAMMLSAIGMLADRKHVYVLLRTIESQSDHRSNVEGDFSNAVVVSPVIVVDDQVSSGNTMRRIAKTLAEASSYINHTNVTVVAATMINNPEEDQLLETLFPNLETIITTERW